MANDARTVVVLAAAQISQDGEQWIEVIPTATEARNGRWFFTITRADLATYARSIQSQPGMIPVDYDHTDGTGTVAAGWFTGDTQIVEAGGATPSGETQDHESLWAKVKWTPQAVEEIRDGRYKRLSPEFTFVDKDAKTGLLTKAKEIVASTLTNRPFFRQLAPVGAEGAVVWDRSAGYTTIREKLSAALNPGDVWRYCILDIDIAGSRALVEDSREAITYVIPFTMEDGDVTVAPSSDWVEAEQEWVSAAREADARHTEGVKPLYERSTSMKEELKPIAAALGLGDDATDEQVIAAAREAKEKADKPDAGEGGDGVVVVLTRAEVDDLKARAQKSDDVEQELLDTRVTAMLDAAERTGRTLPAQRESLTAQCKSDDKFDRAKIDGVKAFIDATPEKSHGLHKAQGSGGDGGGETDAEIAQARAQFEIENEAGKVTAAEGVDIHVAAEKILAAKGKGPGEYSQDEYLRAVAQAEREAKTAA